MPLTLLVTCAFIKEWPIMIIICILTALMNSGLKGVFLRKRPAIKTLGVKKFRVRQQLTNHSFPSGDSAQAGAWTFAMWWLTGQHHWWLWFFTPFAMLGRIYFGCHYL